MSRQITEQPSDWPIRRVWYPTAHAVMMLHGLVMEHIGQEPSEPRDLARLRQALGHFHRPPIHTEPVTYGDRSELTQQATKLMVAIALSQAFADGNKRTALLACDVFLRRHGFRLMTGQVRIAEALRRLVLNQDHNEREARIAELEELIRTGSGPLPRLPITPRNLVDEHRIVLTDEDELAEYRVEQRATSWVKPDQPDEYQTILVAYAQLKERPLPHLRTDERGHSLSLLPLLADPPLSRILVPNGPIRGAVYEGRLTLGFDCRPPANPGGTDGFGEEVYEFPELDNLPPEYRDPAWVLEQAKLMARTTDRALRRLQRAQPDLFDPEPVLRVLEEKAAWLRKQGEREPTQMPELTEEQLAKLGEQGRQTQESIRAWNEGNRKAHAREIAELQDIERQIAERRRRDSPNQ